MTGLRLRWTLTLLLVLGACSGRATLQEGRWTGTLAPMNHPDRTTPVAYEVGSPEGTLQVALLGPDGGRIPTRELSLEADTLRFLFDEPEADVELRCALGRDGAGGFAGRCTDAAGRWARFTMTPPQSPAR